MLSAADAEALGACRDGGGVAVVPTDTVYGLACHPELAAAVERLYEIKGRPAQRPAAVMFFSLEGALAALPDLVGRERAALGALLPGPVTVLLPNRGRRFPLACGPDPDTVGLRVPALPAALAALGGLEGPLLQSSANPSGGRDARRLEDVAPGLREAADLVLDGGELGGVASTVVDLRRFASDGEWALAREGALARQEVGRLIASAHRRDWR